MVLQPRATTRMAYHRRRLRGDPANEDEEDMPVLRCDATQLLEREGGEDDKVGSEDLRT
jgi:hypothetical protein